MNSPDKRSALAVPESNKSVQILEIRNEHDDEQRSHHTSDLRERYAFFCCRHNEVWPEFTFHKKYQTWLPVSNKIVYCIRTVKRSKLHAQKNWGRNGGKHSMRNCTRSTSEFWRRIPESLSQHLNKLHFSSLNFHSKSTVRYYSLTAGDKWPCKFYVR